MTNRSNQLAAARVTTKQGRKWVTTRVSKLHFIPNVPWDITSFGGTTPLRSAWENYSRGQFEFLPFCPKGQSGWPTFHTIPFSILVSLLGQDDPFTYIERETERKDTKNGIILYSGG